MSEHPQLVLLCPPERRDEVAARLADLGLPYEIDVMTALPSDPAPRLYTPEEVAERIGMNVTTFRRRTGQGRFPCTRVGRRVMFSAENIAEIIRMSSQPVQPPARRGRRAAVRKSA